MRTDEGPFPSADRIPAAYGGPMFELLSISRMLDDMSHAEGQTPAIGVRASLMWAAGGILSLAAFLGWAILSLAAFLGWALVSR
jgi:hypothetical protein